MSDFDLSKREIEMIEALGVMRLLNERYRHIIQCLVVRCGGSVTLSSAEMHHDCKTYEMTEDIRIQDMTADVKLSVRLR